MTRGPAVNGITGTTILRGILAFAVALHHADLFRIGYFPLMIGRTAILSFFVLSGWVVAWMFFSTGERPQWTVTKDFYRRRMKRIVPVLIINFLLVCIVTKHFHWPDLGILFPLGWVASDSVANHVLWTLFVEVQFYILAPVILWLVVPRMSWALHLFCYVLIYLLPRVWGVATGDVSLVSTLDTRSLAGNFYAFYAGLWYCRKVLVDGKSPLEGFSLKTVGFLVVGCYGIAAIIKPFSDVSYLLAGVHFAVAGALFSIELSRRVYGDGVVIVKNKILNGFYYLGVISYGYYVYHGFCYMLSERHLVQNFADKFLRGSLEPGSILFFILLVVVPFFMAAFSHSFIEKKLGKLKFKFPPRGVSWGPSA